MSTLPKPVGEELRRARVQAGLDLADVAAHLRIRSNFLSALEEGRPDSLPGLTYAIGYVRTYAGFLGLDPDAAVRRFKEEAAGINAKPQLVFPSPAPEGRVPGLLLMMVAAVLAGGAFGGWYWLSERDGDLRDLVPSVPERLAQLIEGDAPPAISTSPAAAPTAETASPRPAPAAAAAPAAGSYAEANPTGVAVPQPRTTAATPQAATPQAATPHAVTPHAAPPPAAPQRAVESAVAAGSATRAPATASPAPAVTTLTPAAPAPAAPTATAPAATAVPAPAAPTPAPTPALTAQVPAAPAAATASETPADGTPDVTAPPEPTAAGGQPVPGAPPIVAAGRPADPARDVPAAPRIAGLIGSSEAAVPSGRAVGSVDRVMIRATGDSWVQVRDAQGTALFTRVLREGDVYRVPDQGGLRLATGNAGALEILVDGNPAPSLGGFGEVVRNVLLDPTRLSAGTAAGAGR